MIIFAVIGVVMNFIAAYLTREGNSINQKSVNLHMLEYVLGWIVVLIGAIVMNFTDIKILNKSFYNYRINRKGSIMQSRKSNDAEYLKKQNKAYKVILEIVICLIVLFIS